MLEFYLLSEKVSDQVRNVGRCLVNNNHATFLASVERCEYNICRSTDFVSFNLQWSPQLRLAAW